MSISPATKSPEGLTASLFGGEHAEQLFPLLAQMRSVNAVVRMPVPTRGGPQNAWMVTRLEEALQVLKKDELFTVDPSQVGSTEFFKRRASRRSSAPGLLGRSMMTVDEPDHRRLRSQVSVRMSLSHRGGDGHRRWAIRHRGWFDILGWSRSLILSAQVCVLPTQVFDFVGHTVHGSYHTLYPIPRLVVVVL